MANIAVIAITNLHTIAIGQQCNQHRYTDYDSDKYEHEQGITSMVDEHGFSFQENEHR
jgi:hypothetical protein